MKITTKEQRENRERKAKKSYSIAKKNVVRDHSPMKSSPQYRQTSNFGLSVTHYWMSLTGIL